jgi:hypothetical protein
MTPKSRLRPHIFAADPGLRPHPADIEQRGVCSVCHLLGEPGDAHHPEREAAEDVQMRAAGERSEG